jgi:hypothetical protein
MSEKPKVTASDIKMALAARHNRDYFLTEVKSGSTFMGTGNRILDGVALRLSYTNSYLTGYEVKVSRSDFKADNKFFTYLPLVHALYIATPTGMVQREELPTEIGLIWYNPETRQLTVKKKPPPRQIEISRDMLLYIIYSRLERERIPFYSDKATFFRDWLENKRSNAELAQKIRNRMTNEITRLESELRTANLRLKFDVQAEYNELLKIMQNYGMPAYSGDEYIAKWLEARLAREYPEALDDVQRKLEGALKDIEKAKETAQRECTQQEGVVT